MFNLNLELNLKPDWRPGSKHFCRGAESSESRGAKQEEQALKNPDRRVMLGVYVALSSFGKLYMELPTTAK